jgi:NADH-quinone oxidoreductase subunit I
MPYVVKRPERNLWEQSYVPETLRGMGITLRHFFRNVVGRRDTVTLLYPEQRRAYPPRFRSVHRLTQREDGAPRCTSCMCCQTACPAECIHIVAGEYPEGHVLAHIEKYPAEFWIDELRCVFCGLCVEACPCDAIRMDTGLHPRPVEARPHLMYERNLLLSITDTSGNVLTANPRRK